MPTTHKIPARIERRCEPCVHLKRTNMICSRLDGIKCDYTCGHHDCYSDRPLSNDPSIRDKQIVLRTRNAEHGRMIGRDDIQPEWCPLRRSA